MNNDCDKTIAITSRKNGENFIVIVDSNDKQTKKKYMPTRRIFI